MKINKGKFILPALAVAMLAFSIYHVAEAQKTYPDAPPPIEPATTPFGHTVAGSGIVEPNSESSTTSTIAIGSQVSGLVTKVHVRINQTVKAGDLLFELDKRSAEADLHVREAQVGVSDSNVRLQKDQLDRGEKLLPRKAITEQDYVTRLENYRSALAQLELAKVQVSQGKTALELLDVRAPIDGTILQVNIRPGEFVSIAGNQSLIQLGNLQPLHVRVDVDEEDLPRLKLNAPAKAKIRGDARQQEVPLHFVRLEPAVIAKVSLTGANTERVDTRVVQVIYAIEPNSKLVEDKKILVGQLLDVFIDAR
jgi:RND family efflux transporter MFP subunit